MRVSAFVLTVAMAVAIVMAIPTHGNTSPVTVDFLTAPAEGSAREIALAYVQEHVEELGLDHSDLADLVIQDEYASSHNGVTHIYFLQRLGGVEVVNGLINVNVMPDGRIVNLGNRFVSDLSARANTTSPTLAAEQAVEASAAHLGVSLAAGPGILETVGGPAFETVFDGANLSQDPIPVRLMYLPLPDGRVRLVWSLVIRRFETPDWWHMFVDAVTGAVLEKFNWTADTDVTFKQGRSSGAADTGSTAPEGVCTTNCYNVFALPKESPLDGPRTIEEAPWDLTASPFGWHDTNGVPGAEFNDSRGNNVEAQTDLDANNVFGGIDIRANGGPNRFFDFPFDPAQGPETYREFAVTSLFYWNNIIHDIAYQYGFDEPGGNFQTNNYGAGGVGGDPVQADAQDGSGTNNANFSTPPDGFDPRMQMYIWIDSGPVENGRVSENSPTARDFVAARGSWGGSLDPGTSADLELVEDGTGNNEGCNALVGFTPGNIALIDRGSCEFGLKALNAENAGAVGAIIVNNQNLPNGVITMGAGASGGSVTIPAVMIGNADGQLLKDELLIPVTVNVTMQCPVGGCPVPNPINRDSDLDAGIINHEYGHGISNRLVGGPANTGCLSHTERMSEGWSDFWTLVLSATPGQTGEMPRGIGIYSSFDAAGGAGIRNFPYSTDLGVNPQTFGDIGSTNIPHGVGEIWNAMLWEMYWELVDRDGFDPDFYAGTGGNNLTIQLVVDGMKFSVCTPTFVDARDGILAADLANNGGANECEIWHAFAKRGLGVDADSGSPNVVGDEIESFDVPAALEGCLDDIFIDGFESGDTSAWSNSVP